MKEQVNYSVKDFQELLALAMAGDREAAAEILARQDAQKQEIESLKVKASKTRAPKAEKTPLDLAKDNAYFRAALLVKEFGQENVNMQVLTVASCLLDQGIAQGNLRQALNRVSQIIKAQAVTDPVFPDWILTAAAEIPQLDENKKLEEEQEKVAEIKAIVQKYTETAAPETAAPETAAPETAAPAAAHAPAPAKKGGKK